MAQALSFGGWLKQRRRARDLSREALAELVSCATPTLAKIEQGTRRPSRELAALLLDTLGVPQTEREGILHLARMPLAAEEPLARLADADDADTGDVMPVPQVLPAAPAPLVGRDAELRQLRERLGDPACRVMTLIGPGGIGKSRLALAAAAAIGPSFRDGAAWVELAPLQDGATLAATIARAVGCPAGGAERADARLFTFLADRRMLIVLDNLEHLPEAAPLLTEIIRRAPQVTLLLTSRQRLRLPGEWPLPLEGLPTPPAHAAVDIEGYASAQLFLERMRQAGVVGELDGQQRAAIGQICRQVEGIPLAIELAAAWTRTLACAEIAAELTQGLALLSEPKPTSHRHSSMRAVFAQSWALLSAAERQALAALSVLPGSFTRQAAAQVAGVSLSVLAALIEQSLLRRSEDGGQSRYAMHALVRQYAAEHLDPDRAAVVHAAHAAYYTGLLGASAPLLQGAEQLPQLALLEQERDNIVLAWSWASEHGDEQLLARSAPALLLMHELRGRLRDAAALFAQAAARRAAYPGPASAQVRGVLLAWEGWARGRFGEVAVGHTLLAEAAALLDGDDTLLATTGALGSLGLLLLLRGRYDEAAAALERSLALVAPRGLALFATLHSVFLLNVRLAQGDLAGAALLGEQALRLGERGGNQRARVVSRCGGALAAVVAGRPEQAQALAREALSLAAAARDPFGLGLALLMLGASARLRGELAEARHLLIESVETCQAIGDRWNQSRALIQLGAVELALGGAAVAHDTWAAALQLALTYGIDGVAASAATELAALAVAQRRAAGAPLLAALAARPETDHAARQRIARILADLGYPAPQEESRLAESLAELLAHHPALV